MIFEDVGQIGEGDAVAAKLLAAFLEEWEEGLGEDGVWLIGCEAEVLFEL